MINLLFCAIIHTSRGDNMTKLIVIPSSRDMVYDLVDKCDGFILGLKDMAVNLPYYFSYEEIEELIIYLNSKNKDIFISLNKNMHNKDLVYLEDVLIKLEGKKITGIMYYDISIVNMKKRLNLKNDIVWSQEHLTTNYSTINYWYNEGSKYTYISSEITKREIDEIIKNTDSKLLVNVFGYLPIFTSRRHLVDNYLTKFNKDKKDKMHYMYKEGKTYPVIDDELGTIAYSEYILDGLKEYISLDIDYGVVNSFLIDGIDKVLDIFNSTNKDNIDEKEDEIKELISNTSEGFFIQETIYKVK